MIAFDDLVFFTENGRRFFHTLLKIMSLLLQQCLNLQTIKSTNQKLNLEHILTTIAKNNTCLSGSLHSGNILFIVGLASKKVSENDDTSINGALNAYKDDLPNPSHTEQECFN